jgi:hypothetical protein
MNLGSFGGFGGLCYILAVLRGALRFLIKSSYLYNKKKKKKKKKKIRKLGRIWGKQTEQKQGCTDYACRLCMWLDYKCLGLV